MYEEFVKVAQDAMKPMIKLAENNTALTVKLMRSGSDNAAEMIEDHLAHCKALAQVKDLNVAVEMQQKYVEGVNEKLVTVAKDNAAVIEAAVAEAGKIFEGSMAEVQAQARKTVENIEKEISKAAKPAKAAKTSKTSKVA